MARYKTDMNGIYQVSNYGRIKSLNRKIIYCNGKINIYKEKILIQNYNTYKYLNITLVKNKKRKQQVVHILVANAFILNQKNKPQVNHKDGNKQNNKINNLEWVTNSENMKHAYRTGLATVNKTMLGKKGKNNKCSKSIYMINKENNNIIMKFNSQKEATIYIGVKTNAKISLCCNGKKKTAYGYIWRFANEYNT